VVTGGERKGMLLPAVHGLGDQRLGRLHQGSITRKAKQKKASFASVEQFAILNPKGTREPSTDVDRHWGVR
jgi:hypothetical protein